MDSDITYNIVDTETTGLNPLRDRIIEIAILQVRNDKIINKYNTLIDPHVRIDTNITRITNITQEQLNSAPSFADVRSEIKGLLEGKLFVAHNARFDYAFIKNEFKRVDDPITLKTLCTVRLSRKLFPKLTSHSLDNLINEFGIKVDNRHRALSDTKAVFDLLNIAARSDTAVPLDEAIISLKKKPSVPRYLKNSDLESLPEEPGVYIFWGDDLALYIGKSVNIKERVNSHFISDHATSKDLKISSQVKDIEIITTAGELGALLLESRLIKKIRPLYNRMLRRDNRPIKVIKDTSGPYYKAKMIRGEIDVHEHSNILDTFRSIKTAKESLYQIAEEFNLCPNLLDLEKGNDYCFNYQLNKCSGACRSEEDHVKYNVRFIEAFGRHQVRKWPFENAVALIEDNGDKTEAHIINNWCYLGTLSENKKMHLMNKDLKFDYDMYKILKKFILNKNTKLQIKELKQTEIPADFFDQPADIFY